MCPLCRLRRRRLWRRSVIIVRISVGRRRVGLVYRPIIGAAPAAIIIIAAVARGRRRVQQVAEPEAQKNITAPMAIVPTAAKMTAAREMTAARVTSEVLAAAVAASGVSGCGHAKAEYNGGSGKRCFPDHLIILRCRSSKIGPFSYSTVHIDA